MLSQIKSLTQDERQSAQASAQQAVMRAVGERPLREAFDRHTASRYPPSVTKLINGLCIVLLLAAFTPSAIRLFVIGSETFGGAVPDHLAMLAVGIATVLTAEIGQVVFSLALATMGTTASARRLLYASMGIATAIALVGNVQVALPGHMHSPFAWLEAIAPPLLVLSTAYVLKEQLLIAIETRHANERAYQEAVNLWQSATVDPERHPHWMQFYANALRDAIRKANSRRKDALAELTTADWRAMVYRELQADNWYAQPVIEAVPAEQTSEVVEEEPLPLVATVNGSSAHLNHASE
ncbi:MAG: hypothetical protein ACOCXR_02465 [Phototrophicaceae bacterium]